jgi:hypothetical protein
MTSKFVQRSNPKAKARQLAAEWEAMMKRHSKPLFAVKPKPVLATKKDGDFVRDTGPRIPSLNSGGGSTSKSEPKVYTGTKIIGIATMHKSNMVPIFNEEAAIEVAQMRRN